MLQTLLDHLLGLQPWEISGLASLVLLQGAVMSPFPEEVVIVTLGLLYSRGVIPLPIAFLAILVGLLPANALMVSLGRYARSKKPARLGWLGRVLSQKSLEASTTPMDTHRSGLVLLTRFTPLIRGPIYFALGFSGFPLKRFILLDSLASCVQIPLLFTVGARAGENSNTIIQGYLKAAPVLGTIFVFGLAWNAYQRSRLRRVASI